MTQDTHRSCWRVSRDGVTLAEYATNLEAVIFLLDKQPFSVEWACEHEGYALEEVTQ
jgi:hypothetical protein